MFRDSPSSAKRGYFLNSRNAFAQLDSLRQKSGVSSPQQKSSFTTSWLKTNAASSSAYFPKPAHTGNDNAISGRLASKGPANYSVSLQPHCVSQFASPAGLSTSRWSQNAQPSSPFLFSAPARQAGGSRLLSKSVDGSSVLRAIRELKEIRQRRHRRDLHQSELAEFTISANNNESRGVDSGDSILGEQFDKNEGPSKGGEVARKRRRLNVNDDDDTTEVEPDDSRGDYFTEELSYKRKVAGSASKRAMETTGNDEDSEMGPSNGDSRRAIAEATRSRDRRGSSRSLRGPSTSAIDFETSSSNRTFGDELRMNSSYAPHHTSASSSSFNGVSPNRKRAAARRFEQASAGSLERMLQRSQIQRLLERLMHEGAPQSSSNEHPHSQISVLPFSSVTSAAPVTNLNAQSISSPLATEPAKFAPSIPASSNAQKDQESPKVQAVSEPPKLQFAAPTPAAAENNSQPQQPSAFGFGLSAATPLATASAATTASSVPSVESATASDKVQVSNSQAVSSAGASAPGQQSQTAGLSSTPFTFGASKQPEASTTSTSAATPAPLFAFGAATATANKPNDTPKAPFAFGATASSTSTAVTSVSSSITDKSGSTLKAAPFAFGASATTSSAASLSAQNTANTTSVATTAPTFAFGAATTSSAAVTTTSSPFAFGAATSSAAVKTTSSPFAFGAATSSAAVTTTSSSFAFGAATSSAAVTSTSSPFAFGATNAVASTNQSAKAPFNFSSPATSNVTKTPAATPSFGASSASSGPFNFGGSAATAASTGSSGPAPAPTIGTNAAASPFVFGSSASSAAAGANPGATLSTPSSAVKPQLTFGALSASVAVTPSTNSFVFGASNSNSVSQAAVTPAQTPSLFGTAASKAAAPAQSPAPSSGFNFGGTTKPANSTNGAGNASSPFSFSGSTNSSSGFAFGAKPAATPAPTEVANAQGKRPVSGKNNQVSFGATQNNTNKASPFAPASTTMVFGAQQNGNQAKPGTFAFGGNSKNTVNTASANSQKQTSFVFGGSTQTPAAAANNTAAQSNNTPTFSFGATAQPKPQAQAQPFQFGASASGNVNNSSNNGAFQFGAAQQSKNLPAFIAQPQPSGGLHAHNNAATTPKPTFGLAASNNVQASPAPAANSLITVNNGASGRRTIAAAKRRNK